MDLIKYYTQLKREGRAEESKTLAYLLETEKRAEVEQITKELISEGRLPKEN